MAILEEINEGTANLFKLNRDINELSQEEMALIKSFIAEQVARNSADYEKLTSQMTEELSKCDFEDIAIQPQVGFVCKTNVIKSTSNIKPGTSIYINICFNCNLPGPEYTGDEQELKKALNGDPTSTYRLPLYISEPRHEDGHIIMDAVIQTRAYSRALKDLEYKLYVLEIAIENVEQKLNASLSREFKIPAYMSHKGGPIPSMVVKQPKELTFNKLRTALEQRKEEWKPRESIQKKNDELIIVIPMPHQNINEWKVQISQDELLLYAERQTHTIRLKYSIDVNNPENRVDFYKRDKQLVCKCKLLNRRQFI